MSSIEAIINRQFKRWEVERKSRLEAEKNGKKSGVKPIVTVSRQRGSQGTYLAEKLAEKLGYQLLHREVIDEICNSSGYRRQIVESLDDKIRSRIELWFEGVFKGMYIDSSDYFKHLYKVVTSISELGGVVVVGRGAGHMLTREQGIHFRVIAAKPKRIENLKQFQNFNQSDAEKEIERLDKERAAFVRNNFGRDIDDPSVYDLVINTTYLDIEETIRMAEIAIDSKMAKLGSI
jgi:cytidylate kinase